MLSQISVCPLAVAGTEQLCDYKICDSKVMLIVVSAFILLAPPFSSKNKLLFFSPLVSVYKHIFFSLTIV